MAASRKSTGSLDRLTLFNFDQYSLDLSLLSQDVSTRWREPEERFLDSLLWPGEGLHDRTYSTQLIAEGHRRLCSPLHILAFAAVAMAVAAFRRLEPQGAGQPYIVRHYTDFRPTGRGARIV